MNVFLVGTPHQLLNAVEARFHLRLANAQLVVSLSRTYKAAAFEPIVRNPPWDQVDYIYSFRSDRPPSFVENASVWVRRALSFRDDFYLRQQLNRYIRRCQVPETVVLGNYNYASMRHFANRLKCPNVVLLDDGTETLAINHERRHLSGGGGVIRPKSRMQLLRERLSFDVRHLPKVTFFTTYKFEPVAGDSVVKNSYNYCRRLAAGHAPGDEIFFVGQPLADDGLITREQLIEYLRMVNEHFAGERFVYLPHKRERAETVRALRERCALEVRNFEVPIEYQMSVRGTRPRVLASFFSSALENSRVIFGPLLPIKCFRISPEEFMNRRDEISMIYSHFAGRQNEHFEVVNLSKHRKTG